MSRFVQTLAFYTAAVAMLGWLAAPDTAHAQQRESNVTGSFDVQFGPYYPRVDDEFDNATPFEQTFGSSSAVMFQADALYYLWTGHGKLGVGATFGYSQFSGTTQVGGSNGGNGGGGNGGGNDGDVQLEKTSNFSVFPLGLIASYRWDFLVTEWNIPLALRVEGGLDYYLWELTDGSGDNPSSSDVPGAGGTPGYHAAGRLEFLLDWLDPTSAAQLDFSWGINNTYLFAEYSYSQVRDFDGSGFRLGDTNWRIGLSFDF